MSARDAILGRIRSAAGGQAAGDTGPAVSRDYRQRWEASRDEIVERFALRLHDYGVTVVRAETSEQIATAAARQLQARGITSLVVPEDLPASWWPAHPQAVHDAELSHRALNEIGGVMTGCALGIAETGSIVLDSGHAQGRRRLTLLPDYQFCVVFTDQIVGLMPEAIAQLSAAGKARAPITFISGPSATADIELNRVQGVHGPRTLDVLLVGASTMPSRFGTEGGT